MSSKPQNHPAYFVTQTNPEIFLTPPRPGGIAKIEIPPKTNKLRANAAKSKTPPSSSTRTSRSRSRMSKIAAESKSKIPPPDSKSTPSRKSLLTVTTTFNEPFELNADDCPKDYKVKQILAATPWSVEFDDYLEPSEESTRRNLDPFQDSVDMLAMSFSVIMLLSRGYQQISDTHFKWVYSYLDCVRDEFGRIPPNIQGILNHINQATGGRVTSLLEEDFEPDELENREGGVKISKLPPDVAPPAPTA